MLLQHHIVFPNRNFEISDWQLKIWNSDRLNDYFYIVSEATKSILSENKNVKVATNPTLTDESGSAIRALGPSSSECPGLSSDAKRVSALIRRKRERIVQDDKKAKRKIIKTKRGFSSRAK